MESFADYMSGPGLVQTLPLPSSPHGCGNWNQHDNVLACLPRSFNFAERWHNAFQCLMGCSNPTIWRFIDVLKKEQPPPPLVELTCVSNYSPGSALQFDRIEF